MREQYCAGNLKYEKGQLQRHGFGSPNWMPTDETFFSFEKFVKHREEFAGAGNDLRCVFNELMKRPNEEDIKVSAEVLTGLNQLSGGGGINGNWHAMTRYWKWIAQLYSPEMITEFGGLSILNAGLLAIGMVSLLRSCRVE